MAFIHTFLGAQPPARYDLTPWTGYRVEEASSAAGPWTLYWSAALSPLDVNPADPMTRNITFESSLGVGYFRITWVDDSANTSVPTEPIYDDGSTDAPDPPEIVPGAYTSVGSLKSFTAFTGLQNAPDGWLAGNIIPRAEAWLDAFGPFIVQDCPNLNLAANLIAQFLYLQENPGREKFLSATFKSESMGDYSYTLNDATAGAGTELLNNLLSQISMLVEICQDPEVALPVAIGHKTDVFTSQPGYMHDLHTGEMISVFSIEYEQSYIHWYRTVWSPQSQGQWPWR